ncbi:hypothetical protein TSUD_207270 [Trifolium subterraneum]|uniref:Reverse transcriptase domain-containing protein n=1 Tax=Trifolium subterraneum TaxID=3900 RepID=A0A2Z6MZS3_TRISU|nr:hypothetical protein TSUD_207270 [Trifolium subterraneum]
MDLAKKRKDKCILFKVDFERAYDTINWSFLERMMIKMGFAEGWLKWMRTCICQSSMSVLVNGSSTKDFNVFKGLRQGDPLSPFLFLIVAEGLTGMVRRAVELGKFKGYKVSESIQFQILQFADDMILMGENSWDNLWTIKTVLRGFEMVSGLKINFNKSKLYGINVEEDFLEAGSTFLSCRSDVIPFKFLGIPVGANPRRKETWRPVVEAMSTRFSRWSGSHLTYGGRITLINSVLASLPLYFFSFFKASICVLNQLVSIQRNFLWGGGLEEKKMCWVKWDHVCLPRDLGGLGVKNLKLFNIALLSKWKWRCVNDSEAVWKEVLRHRYGHLSSFILNGVPISSNFKTSIWWKDMVNIGETFGYDWFQSNTRIIVGNGNNIAFWTNRWLGNNVLSDLFPNLFDKEAFKDAKVADRVINNNDGTIWRWEWRGRLTEAEELDLAELQVLLTGFSLNPTCCDRWKWIPDSVGDFTIKSCYNVLIHVGNTVVLSPHLLVAIRKLWKNDLPSKVGIFGWRLLLEKLPTRAALAHRNILNTDDELLCVFCSRVREDSNHLFFNRVHMKYLWRRIHDWLGNENLSPDLVSNNVVYLEHEEQHYL